MNPDVRLGHNDASVIFERFGEEVVVIHLGTGRYYSLPGVAADAFLLLANTRAIPELAYALAAKYEASAQTIAADLGNFLDQLKDESLIVEQRTARAHTLAPSADAAQPRQPYLPPAVHPHRDLENLFLVDPIHEVGEAGWPQRKEAVEIAPGTPMRYRFAADRCLFEQFEDATIALNLNTGAYFSFAGTAEDILLLINEAPTSAEIVKALETKYVAAREELAAEVARFLDRLAQTDIVLAEETEGEPEPRLLALKRPGKGEAFHAPEIEAYRDAPAISDVTDAEPASSLLSKKKKFRLNRGENILGIVEGGAVGVQLMRGDYFVWNATAARVLHILQQEHEPTASDIVSALEVDYEARRPELVAAVIVLLQNFIGIGVATAGPAGEEFPPTPPRAEKKTDRLPFEPFAAEMVHDFRHQLCLYPGGNPMQPEPASRGRQLAIALEEYFEEASSRAPLTETRLLVAGKHLHIRSIDGVHSRHLTLALSHLRHQFAGEGDFTIHVWDCEEAGPPSNPMLAPYLQALYRDWTASCGVRGELRGFHSPRVQVFYMPGPDILNLVDVAAKQAFFLKRDSSPLPYWEAGSPFRAVLHTWLSSSGLQFVHGGAVGEAGGGVLLAGRGGSGKSTTTLLCLNAGMQYAGDDYCAVDCDHPAFVHSLYNTAKLLPADLDRFPDLRKRIWNPQALVENSTDKATFFLGDVMPERMSAGFPLRALLVPRITPGTASSLQPCGPAAALSAMAPSTIAQLPMAGQADMDRMAALATSLPTYILHLGSDLAQIPDVVRSVLR